FELNPGIDPLSFHGQPPSLSLSTSISPALPHRDAGTTAVTRDHLRDFFAGFRRPLFPESGMRCNGPTMRLKEKLQILMARHSLNGQRLAKLSQVSDSEISRILQGKSRPGLDNAFRLAKAVNVSLDFLADDSLDMDASSSGDLLSPDERKVLNLTQKIGAAEVVAILE